MMPKDVSTYPELKHIFNTERINLIADLLSTATSAFNRQVFVSHAIHELENLNLMQRMRQISEAYFVGMKPLSLAEQFKILRQIGPAFHHGFAAISLCEFVARYGLDDLEASLSTLHFLTQFGSAEFAIRPFIEKYPTETMKQMQLWSHDNNEHVRRLASEGCRPRLPWSFQLSAMKQDPSLAWPILTQLNQDDSLYVRKSVANHLNDISKDHPEWLLEQLKNWDRSNLQTQWIIRHGLRTLIKQGHPEALNLIGVSTQVDINVSAFSVTPTHIELGQSISIELTCQLNQTTDADLVIDYAMIYPKANGKMSRKVFKWKRISLIPNQSIQFSKQQLIKDFSTRKHYAGLYQIELLINGRVYAETSFHLSLNEK